MMRYLGAWASPDVQDLLALCAPDVKMHVGGDHSLSGTYVGEDGVRELHRKTQAATGSNFSYELDDVLADDQHAVAVMILKLRQGDRVLEGTTVGAVKIDPQGLVTEAWYLTSDQTAENRFLS
jgi:ketosteroid isomerase-like protein